MIMQRKKYKKLDYLFPLLKIQQEDLKRDWADAEVENAEISSEKEDICSMFVISFMTLKVHVLGK